MSVYLQFDSAARTDPYIQNDLGLWVPNDNYSNEPNQPYQLNKDLVQTPTNYRVFYRELNDANNIRTISFLAHCRERPTNLNFSVELCVLTLPANAIVPRIDNDGVVTYVSVLDEPYLYIRMMPINHAEGNLVYSNNPAADEATFVVWLDRIHAGTDSAAVINNPVPRPNSLLPVLNINTARWVVYKTCMSTVMRMDLDAEEWQIRIYDRFGNDVIIGESDNGGAGFIDEPTVNPDLQTMILVGIKPNYPL